MSDQTYRKPLLLAFAGAVAVTAALCAYNHYQNQPQTDTERATSLHRSNAIRRPRGGSRQLRNDYQPVLDYDPIDRAIRHLQQRNQDRQGYGEYHNTWCFPTLESVQGIDLTLIPCNLNSIYEYIVEHSPSTLSPYRRDCLRAHLHCFFVQNFLQEEFREDFKVGDDISTLATALEDLLVDSGSVYRTVSLFDAGEASLKITYNPFDEREPVARSDPAQTDGGTESGTAPPREILQALVDEPLNDDDSDSSISFGNNEDDPGGSQNMLDLLYHIAGEQARREGYIHRGVECNSCGIHPISGIRYHCANCFDFDLCESCEANTSHVKSHVFYKIRIPAPSRGNVKQVTPKWYPGNPDAFHTSLPSEVSKPLLAESGIDRTEMDALYEQYKCVAGHNFPADPTGLGVAIDRKAFNAYFIPSNGDRPSPANLIYDRIFAFYDTDRNGLITFDEYVRGLARLQDKSRTARLRRIFEGYDLDGDSYVDRKDFLRMFRAYYALSKELSREMINTQGDFGYNEEELHEVVRSSAPISAAFGGGNLYGHESRTGQDKQYQATGDLQLINGSTTVLQHDTDMRGDRARAIGNAAHGDRTRNHPFRSFRRQAPEDEPVLVVPGYAEYERSSMEQDEVLEEDMGGPDASLQTYPWPPLLSPLPEDISNALGQEVALEDVTDPIDRTRVLYAQSQRLDAAADRVEEAGRDYSVNDRWRRRQFYLDEEEGLTQPPGYTEPDSSDEEDDPQEGKKRASPRRASMASRSSSRVRFDDSAIDTDYETRSNTSSRSIPLNERWGGYELSQAEADIGKDILYQAVQQGFNQLLDALFKEKEDAYMAAQSTHNDRRFSRKEWKEFGVMLQRNGCMDDLREAAEVDLLAKKNEKEEARHLAAGMTDHLDNRDKVLPTADGLAKQDAEDHIGLMLGTHARPPSGVPDAVATHVDVEEDYRDPTLPQFRPDEAELSLPSSVPGSAQPDDPESTKASLSTTQTQSHEEFPSTSHITPFKDEFEGTEPTVSSRLQTQSRSTSAPKRPNPFAGHPNKARATYYLWRRHDLIDAEANRRGGGGKLSFTEFRRKMVPEEEVGAALGDKSKPKDADKEADTWESSADMGKLAFVGTWLDMASF